MTDDQQRLQEYGTGVGAPPVEEAPPACDRCGDELDGDDREAWPHTVGRPEHETGYIDIHEFGDDPVLCPDCRDLVRYLTVRYRTITDKPGVSGAVAIHCACQDDDEVDVRPVGYGGDGPVARCSRCGSAQVVVEELPPDDPVWRVEQ